MRGIINMNVDGVHEKFIYHTKNLACCCHIQVHRFTGSRRVRGMEVLPEHKRRPRNAMTPDKKPSATENFSTKFSRRFKNVTPAATSSPVEPVT
jgi:hypothetical protein